MIKTRAWNKPHVLGYSVNTSGGKAPHNSLNEFEESILTSTGNYRWQKPRNPGDTGSPFSVVRKIMKHQDSAHVNALIPSSGGLRYVGQFGVGVGPSDPGNLSPGTAAYGALAYDRLKPTKPTIDGLNAIIELRDLPSMIRQRFTLSIKSAANAHLAYQFGWKPLLADCQKLYVTHTTLQARLKWLLDHEGQPIRVKKKIFETESMSGHTNTVDLACLRPTLNNAAWAGTQVRSTFSEERHAIWACARFRFWLPKGPRDVDWTDDMIRKLYGLHIRPIVVYNAIPWTWLIDWFTGAASVVANLDAGVADRLAADYFYIMGHRSRSNWVKSTGVFNANNSQPDVRVSAQAVYLKETKERLKGNPFGFNVSQINLSDMQLSILAALGISRL